MANTTDIENLNPEALNTILAVKPELRDEMVASLDQKISELQTARAALAGGPATKSRKGNIKSGSVAATNKMAHTEAIIETLKLPEAKGGLRSRDIRELAEAKFDHNFGRSMGTTLSNLFNSERIKCKAGKDTKEYLYYV